MLTSQGHRRILTLPVNQLELPSCILSLGLVLHGHLDCWCSSVITFLSVIQTRKTAGWLAGELSREGHQVALLSGEMQVEQRAAVIDRFRDGKEKVLVTTNVCARGKDKGHQNRQKVFIRLSINLLHARDIPLIHVKWQDVKHTVSCHLVQRSIQCSGYASD